MKKSEAKFHRDRKIQVDNLSRKKGINSMPWYQDNNPIFIPKRKKKK